MKHTNDHPALAFVLSESLVFSADGHLSDLGVSIFADAELGLLPLPAVHHGETCDACALRIGEIALRSEALRVDLRAAMAHAKVTQAKFPVWAVGLAAAVSALFALPVFGQAISAAHNQSTALAHSAPLALRSIQSSLSTAGVMLVCTSMLAILACTFLGRRILARASA